MSVNVEMDSKLEARIDAIIKDIRAKQDERKLEVYKEEAAELIHKHGEFGLLVAGCKIVKSDWANYIILPEKYIEDAFIPGLKTKMALIFNKNKDE